MKLLAIETSQAIGSVAILDDEHLLERLIDTPRQQTEQIIPIVDELLAESGFRLQSLDALVFGRGPGSFTGLRVAAAVTQGLALSSGLGVIGVSSLAAIAQRAWREQAIKHALVCIDARMAEVYWASFQVDAAVAECVGVERIGRANTVEKPDAVHFAAVGNGFTAYADEFAPLLAQADRLLPDVLPSARDLLPQARRDYAEGRLLQPENALPVYLRDESAWHR